MSNKLPTKKNMYLQTGILIVSSLSFQFSACAEESKPSEIADEIKLASKAKIAKLVAMPKVKKLNPLDSNKTAQTKVTVKVRATKDKLLVKDKAPTNHFKNEI